MTHKKWKKVPKGFSYRSDNNTVWMTKADIVEWIKNEYETFNID